MNTIKESLTVECHIFATTSIADCLTCIYYILTAFDAQYLKLNLLLRAEICCSSTVNMPTYLQISRYVSLERAFTTKMSRASHYFQLFRWRGGATGRLLDMRSTRRGFNSYSRQSCVRTLGKLFTPMCLCRQAV